MDLLTLSPSCLHSSPIDRSLFVLGNPWYDETPKVVVASDVIDRSVGIVRRCSKSMMESEEVPPRKKREGYVMVGK